MIYQNSNNQLVGSNAYIERRRRVENFLCSQFPIFEKRKQNNEPVLPFFGLDESDPEEIERAKNLGMSRIDKITTNPNYLYKALLREIERRKERKKDLKNIDRFFILNKIFQNNPEIPISVEVNSLTTQQMIDEARLIRDKLNNPPNLVIKIPASGDKLETKWTGISAIEKLKCENPPFKINCTAIFNPGQAIFPALAGASFLSIFISRNPKYDQIPPLFDFIRLMEVLIVQQISIPVIAASIHDTATVIDIWTNGADGITAMFSDVWDSLLFGLRNNVCLNDFLESHQKAELKEIELLNS